MYLPTRLPRTLSCLLAAAIAGNRCRRFPARAAYTAPMRQSRRHGIVAAAVAARRTIRRAVGHKGRVAVAAGITQSGTAIRPVFMFAGAAAATRPRLKRSHRSAVNWLMIWRCSFGPPRSSRWTYTPLARPAGTIISPPGLLRPPHTAFLCVNCSFDLHRDAARRLGRGVLFRQTGMSVPLMHRNPAVSRILLFAAQACRRHCRRALGQHGWSDQGVDRRQFALSLLPRMRGQGEARRRNTWRRLPRRRKSLSVPRRCCMAAKDASAAAVVAGIGCQIRPDQRWACQGETGGPGALLDGTDDRPAETAAGGPGDLEAAPVHCHSGRRLACSSANGTW